MRWVRFEAGFPLHPKVCRLSDSAFRLHVSVGLMSDVKRPRQAAAELVAADLWECVAGGWLIHRDVVGSPKWGPTTNLCRRAIPDEIRSAVYARDAHRCVECGSSEKLTLDHIIPWSLGGPDDEANLQTMCRPCNSRKGARV